MYETDTVIGFLTIDPLTPGHTLIVPKQPFTNVFDADPVVLGDMMVAAQAVSQALLAADLASGVNLLMNNGPIAGQEVFHAHLHVIPRTKPEEAITLCPHYQYADGEADRLMADIKANF